MNSVPNQKTVYIDREKVDAAQASRKFVIIYTDNLFIAHSLLTPSGFAVYLYLISQQPYFYDGKKQTKSDKNKTSSLPFILSPQAMKNSELNLAVSSSKVGIKDLIEKGFLKEKDGRWFFYELPTEYRPKTIEEYKEMKEFDAELAYKELQTAALQKQVLQQREQQQSSFKKNAYHDTWMDDHEYWIEDEEKSRLLTYNELHSSTYNFINMKDVTDWSRVPTYLKNKRGITL